MGSCCSCLSRKGSSTGNRENDPAYEPLLVDREREAVARLLTFLENRQDTDFYHGEPLECLKTLVYSENIDLQRSSALAFAEITEKDIRPVDKQVIEPILYLLQINDPEILRAASAALGNFAVDNTNKLTTVELGGLEILIGLMMSPNTEVLCNAVGCITNLATHDDNKPRIARSGALIPLTKLAHSRDMRVQRNATGALLNMTHSEENRAQLVKANAIPVLVSLLKSPDTDVQYYCTTALSNLAVDAIHRQKLAETEPTLVSSLIRLMDSPSAKVQCQAALALRNLASDEKYQVDIVRLNGLSGLLRLLQSPHVPLILASVACIRNISIHPLNEAPIIDAGFLRPLVSLLCFTDNEEIQCHAISTLRNLAASSEKNKRAIVEAGSVHKCVELIATVPLSVQSEMTACIAVLALSDELKPILLNLGVYEALLPLTQSPSQEIQGNSAAALGNLSSRGDSSAFVRCWSKPAGGLEKYFQDFLNSKDETFQHIAVWTVLQLLESDEEVMPRLIRTNKRIVESLQQIAAQEEAQKSATGEYVDEDDADTDISALASRCLELLEE